MTTEILIFKPCDLHPRNTVEIWRNGKPSGSSTSFPGTYAWDKVIREAHDLAQDYCDTETSTPAPVFIAHMDVYRDGDEIKARVTKFPLDEMQKVYDFIAQPASEKKTPTRPEYEPHPEMPAYRWCNQTNCYVLDHTPA